MPCTVDNQDLTRAPSSRYCPSKSGFEQWRVQALVDRCFLDDAALFALSARTAERIICTSAHTDADGRNALGDALCLAGSFSGGNGLVDRVAESGMRDEISVDPIDRPNHLPQMSGTILRRIDCVADRRSHSAIIFLCSRYQ